MSINLITEIQRNLSYPELEKIDPNTEEPKHKESDVASKTFSQAAIPAVLTGLYKYVQTDEAAVVILQGQDDRNWVEKFFGEDAGMVVQNIIAYSSNPVDEDYVTVKMNAIATEAIRLIRENIKSDADVKELKTFVTDQRNNILLYLPPELHLGDHLQDNTLDDNTNKMEGPVSSLMQNIGSIFSSPVTDEELNKKGLDD